MSDYQLLLPKMGESVAEATIIKWLKNPGDYIEADESILEIATDKVDSEVPSPVAGKLMKQLFKVDEVVQVGAVIALVQVEDKVAAGTPPPAPVQAAPVVQPPVISQTSNIPGLDQLENKTAAPAQKTQQFSTSEGNKFYSPLVKSIAAQEGISLAVLDSIAGTGADGRLTKEDLLNYLQSGAGKQLQPQTPVAQQQPLPQVQNQVAAAQPQPATSIPQQPVTTQQPYGQPMSPVYAQQAYMPQQAVYQQAPYLIYQQVPQPVYAPPGYAQPFFYAMPPGYQQVTQTIYPPQPEEPQAEAQPAKKPAGNGISAGAGDEIIEMDRMRRLIAEHMVNSVQTAPHVTSFIEADVTDIVQWRERSKQAFETKYGEKLTFTPIFIEAVAHAIKAMPMINVSVSGTQIIKRKNINIGMATALLTGNLIVPVIRNADALNLAGLAKSVNDLANRARINKLQPDEIKEGTFTITNVGTFGNVMGTPIINQPQVAILALGAIKKKPAVVETPNGDEIAIRHMMFLSLSYDHRVVDGSLGGSFIKKVTDYLEGWDINREI